MCKNEYVVRFRGGISRSSIDFFSFICFCFTGQAYIHTSWMYHECRPVCILLLNGLHCVPCLLWSCCCHGDWTNSGQTGGRDCACVIPCGSRGSVQVWMGWASQYEARMVIIDSQNVRILTYSSVQFLFANFLLPPWCVVLRAHARIHICKMLKCSVVLRETCNPRRVSTDNVSTLY